MTDVPVKGASDLTGRKEKKEAREAGVVAVENQTRRRLFRSTQLRKMQPLRWRQIPQALPTLLPQLNPRFQGVLPQQNKHRARRTTNGGKNGNRKAKPLWEPEKVVPLAGEKEVRHPGRKKAGNEHPVAREKHPAEESHSDQEVKVSSRKVQKELHAKVAREALAREATAHHADPMDPLLIETMPSPGVPIRINRQRKNRNPRDRESSPGSSAERNKQKRDSLTLEAVSFF